MGINIKLRLDCDNWDYGTVGEMVEIGDALCNVGNIYKVKHWTWDNKQITSECMVVNKLDEYSDNRIPMLMGIGELGINERMRELISMYNDLKLGSKHKSLIISET